MTTTARIRVMQDRALADGHGAATVALYGGLVTTVAHLLGEDTHMNRMPDDVVLQVAMREVPTETRDAMAQWLVEHWTWIEDSAAVLDCLDAVPDLFPEVPTEAAAYRLAAQELTARAGEPTAAVVWAGAAAEARYQRLFSGMDVDNLDAFEADPVFAAARRELPETEKDRLTDAVVDGWDRIDNLAEELIKTGVGR